MRIMTILFISVFFLNAQAASLSMLDVSRDADKGQTSSALKKIDRLVQTKRVASDLGLMTKARLHFQRAELKKAIQLYDQVPKSSEYWFEAVEEKAHSLGRLGQYADALAALESVLVEPFQHLTGPEPYFIAALTHLKICNYEGVLTTTSAFKKRFTTRLAALKTLSEGGSQETIKQIALELKNSPVSFDLFGKYITKIPRHLHRDSQLIKKPSLLSERAKVLAKSEIAEIQRVVNKLQIIEAEVVHRVHLAEKSTGRSSIGSIPSGSDYIIFPKDDDVWIDEIGSYATQIEKCPQFKSQVSL